MSGAHVWHRAAALLGASGVALGAYGIKKIYDTPSRTYDNNVGDEYDSWTQEGILEYYWGEHIHLGYYTDEARLARALACASLAAVVLTTACCTCSHAGARRWLQEEGLQGCQV